MARSRTAETDKAPLHQPPIADRVWKWIDERLGLEALAYPVPAHANSVLYTLGGITLFGILVLIATGIYLAQFYHADPTEARQGVEYIITTARLGDFVRSLHFWMANLVTITLLLHTLRVFMTGGYRAPRELNWVVGVGLLAAMLGLVFTGTVLKWDQEGWEALQHNEEIGNLLGGVGIWFTSDFTTSTPILERLFIAHIAILPVLLIGLVAAHFFLVKYHGISSLPGHDEQREAAKTDTAHRPASPDLPDPSMIRQRAESWRQIASCARRDSIGLKRSPISRVAPDLLHNSPTFGLYDGSRRNERCRRSE